MTTLIRVKSGHTDSTVALWERHPLHPHGEIFVAGDRVVEVALTRRVEAALKEGVLVKASEQPTGTEAVAPLVVHAETGTPLPDDFPARDELVKAGLDTREKVDAATDTQLRGIRGIGPTTLRDIREAP